MIEKYWQILIWKVFLHRHLILECDWFLFSSKAQNIKKFKIHLYVNFGIVKINDIAYKKLFNLSVYIKIQEKKKLKIKTC